MGHAMRTIVVGGREYRYKVGRGIVVFRVGDDAFKVPIETVTGRTPDVIERGRRKRTFDGMVTPSEIAQYLRATEGDRP